MMIKLAPQSLFVGLIVLGFGAGGLEADPITYVDRGSPWRYFRGLQAASSPDAGGWREPDFDDNSWAVGEAPFGYGDGPFRTDLSTLDPPMRNNYLTLFLRQSFELSNPSAVVAFEAAINYDDGFAIWINDVLVLRENAPDGFAHDAAAPGNHESGTYDIFDLPDPDGYLRAGSNVIAVQVFNTSITSSDLHFDIELVDPIGVDASPPTIESLVPGIGSRVRSLTSIEVTFDEAVVGVDASDLRINGNPSAGLTGSADGPWVFSFPEPPDGDVAVAWATDPGIEDLAPTPNAFEPGAPWTYDLDPNAPLGMIVINELLASNQGGLTDEDGDSSDWFELLNIGAETVNIGGWSVTDDRDEPGKFVLPARSLAPNEHLVIFASGKDRRPGSGEIHASFQLNTASEHLGLYSNESPRQAVSGLEPTYPPQRTNVAYGRAGAGQYAYLVTPTPGSPNSGSQTVAGFVTEPVFSHERGYYDRSFDLALSSATPDVVIYYTTDGSRPTDSTGTRYNNPVRIAGSSTRAVRTIRAVAYRDGFLPSHVVTSSYLFAERVLTQPSNPTGFPSSWPGTAADYQMDPQVINRAGNRTMAIDALETLPTISIVSEIDELFGSSRGNVTHPSSSGDAWEREVSVEMIHPQGGDGFQVDSGFRVQGGSSTNGWKSKKTSFRLVFRGEYGHTKLRYRFFEDSQVDRFNSIVLDAHLNLTFTHPSHGQRVRSQYVRDMFVSDLQLALGSLAPHSRLCNLFINGLFWGVYDAHERPDNHYCTEYLGGEAQEWDIHRHSGGTVVDGNGAAWNTMMSRVRANLSNNSNYLAAAEHLDVLDFADYMIVNLWAGNDDWPHHNWYAGRQRVPGGVYRFFSWDAEHVLKDVNVNRLGVSNSNTPGEVFRELRESDEFRLLFADRVHHAFFNGGPLHVNPANRQWDPESPGNNVPAQLYMKRIEEIDHAMVLEAARWGDVRREPPYTREDTFLTELDWLITRYFPNRSRNVLSQFENAGLYPSVDAPVFNRHGGEVAPGFSLTITRPAGQSGTIWYTLDGTDPREFGSGDPSDSATTYSNSIEIDTTTDVNSRIRRGTTWSALNQTIFTVPTRYDDLLVTEIMYHAAADSRLDFLELENSGTTPLNLSGLEFTRGIEYRFPRGSILPADGFLVLAADGDAFDSGYPGVGHDDVYGGNLDNSGEVLTLVDPLGHEVLSFRFDDRTSWPISPDGFGYSLVLADRGGDPDNPSSWRASTEVFGSPGEEDPPPVHFGVVVNEVLARTAAPFEDAIELHNTTGRSVDIGGWYLSDDRQDLLTLRKFRIPTATVIPGGGHVVFYEHQFNDVPGSPSDFALDGAGDRVFLSSADASTTDLTGYITGASWNALESAVSYGRHETSTGPDYAPLSTRTFGADNPASVEEFRSGLGLANSYPLVGPVVIHEIHYHPAPGGEEYIELFNLTPDPVDLFDDDTERGWQVRGVSNISETDSYEFSAGASIGANGFALLVASDPELFRSRHAVPRAVPVHGPFRGSLDNGGERLRLMRPARAEALVQPFIVVDKVVYDDSEPWPIETDGDGPSLERRIAADHGNDPENWGPSEPRGGTPGTGNSIGPPPPNQPPSAVFTASPQDGQAALDVRFDATGSDDPDGRIVSFDWSFDDGASDFGRIVDHRFAEPGVYDVRLTVTDDDGESASASLRVTVTVPLPNESPTAAFTIRPSTGEAPFTATFDASDSTDADGTIARYDWTFDEGATASGRIVSYTFLRSGSYSVSLTVTDDDGASATTTNDLTVTEPGPNRSPVPSFTMTPSRGEPPLQVIVDASGSNDPDGSITRYSWDFGDGGVGLGRILGHTFPDIGEYTITLTVRDDDGAEASTSRILVVGDGGPNEPPVSSFTVTPDRGAPPLRVTVDASASNDPDGFIVSYEWDWGDGGSGLGRTLTHVYEDEGTYTITLVVRDGDAGFAFSTAVVVVEMDDGPGSQRPGDCNQDGDVDVSDAVCLLGHLFLGSPSELPCGDGSITDPGNLSLIDVNGDAGGDLADAVHLLGYLFQGGPPPTLGRSCRPMPGCPDACAP